MIDTVAVSLALRNQALLLSVCTTGSTTLSATATGYNRTAGSFITDGFKPGMEVRGTGSWVSTNNVGYSTITQVTSTDLTIDGGRTVESAGAGKTLIVGVPETRAWENRDANPIPGRSWLREEFVPAGSFLRSYPAQGATMEESGLYILTWFGLPKYGEGAIRKSVDALRALFTSGTILLAGTTPVRITGTSPLEPGPFAGQILPDGNGWMYCQLRIPWACQTINAVAA